jgi:hypothetical protein
MAGTVSLTTSQAIYDDALRAYADERHPCHKFRSLQPEVDQAGWQLPEPFNGDSANAGVVFLGLNPSYGGPEWVPPLGTEFKEWDAFYRRRFDGDPSNWALLYRRYQQLGEQAVGASFRLGRDAIVLEVVRFRSARGAGVNSQVLDQERPLTRRLLQDVEPLVIVSTGSWVLWELRRLFPTLADRVPAIYRMRDLQGQIFEVAWPDRDRTVRILVSPHPSGSFGFSRRALDSLGDRLRTALDSS